MENKKITLIELFKKLFVINLVTFGGGYTIIPVIKDEFVYRGKYIEEDDMIKIVSLAFSYTKLIENVKIKNILSGISGSIMALLIITVINLVKKEWESPKKYFYISITIISFLVKLIFNVQVMYILIVSGILGYWYNRGDK